MKLLLMCIILNAKFNETTSITIKANGVIKILATISTIIATSSKPISIW